MLATNPILKLARPLPTHYFFCLFNKEVKKVQEYAVGLSHCSLNAWIMQDNEMVIIYGGIIKLKNCFNLPNNA